MPLVWCASTANPEACGVTRLSTELLERVAPLVGIMAREKTAGNPSLYDDARQEGLIRAWLAQQKYDADNPRAYMVAAARSGISGLLRGRPPFGAEGRRGWRDAHDTSVSLTSSIRVDERENRSHASPSFDEASLADEAARRDMEHAETAPIRDAVRAAVATLPRRDQIIILSRFAHRATWPEVAKVAGSPSADAARIRFADHIAPALRALLSKDYA